MKRHLVHIALGASLAMPLMAQDSSYPGYGYDPDGGYGTDTSSRQFTINPGDMMNRMGNPMRNMFGSSNRRYGDYPAAGYAPPAYPPAYGHPVYPGYQAPYAGYGYPSRTPGYPTTGGAPSAPPTQAAPAPPPRMQPPAYETIPPAATQYQPRLANPEQASHYRFRPLEEAASPPAQAPVEPTLPEPAVNPPAAVYRLLEPPAPQTYPGESAKPDPLAPLSHPDTQAAAPAPEVEMRDPRIEQNPKLRFRPLDKPGYSSELDE